MTAKFERGHGVRVCGFVERAFVPPSGKCAFLTVAVPGRPKEQKIEMRTFDKEDLIPRIKALGVGQIVTVTAGIESNKLTNKARQEVQVDGRTAWVMVLTIRTLAVEGEAEKAKEPEKTQAAPKTLDWEEEDKKNGIDW